MKILINHIREWFIPRKEYFDVFAINDTRLESWFKAELLVLLERLRKQRVIDTFERELSIYSDEGRSQIDFSVTIDNTTHFFELKALCISQSKGTPRNLSFYFRNDNIGVIKDFKKLDRINSTNKWVIAFIYPKPEKENWDKVTSKLKSWKCLSSLEDYPSHVFIALFH